MTDNPIPLLRVSDRIMTADGRLESWFVDAWNALVLRTGTEFTNSLYGVVNGLVQSQINAATQAASAAATSVSNLAAATAAGGGLSLYVTATIGGAPCSVAEGSVEGAGVATTPTVTFTATGGTPPYSYSGALLGSSGVTITGALTNTPVFSKDLGNGEFATDSARWTVTDSAGTPNVYAIDIGVSLSSIIIPVLD